MKPAGLMKLILLSFALVAFWLASAPGSEHPWDDDEVVASDSGNIYGDQDPAEPGTDEVDVVMFISASRHLRPLGFGLFFIRADGGKNTFHRTSIQRTRKPRYDLPVGRLIDIMK